MNKIILSMFAAMALLMLTPDSIYAADDIATATGGRFSFNGLIDLLNPDLLSPEEKSLFKTLFGTFAVNDNGIGETTVLSRVVGYTSIAALAVAVAILTYVIPGSAIHTATSGEPLGRSWSSVWLPLRVSIGVGMILPTTVGGGAISFVQYFVYKLAVFGSGFASLAWGFVTTDIASYDSTIVSSVQAPKLDTYVDLANSAICSAQEKWRKDNIGRTTKPAIHYSIEYYTANGELVEYEETAMPSGNSFKLPAGSVLSEISFSESGNCGSMSLFPKLTEQTPKGSWAAYQNASQIILEVLNRYTQLIVMARNDNVTTKAINIAVNAEIEEGDRVRSYVDSAKKAIAADAAQYPAKMVNAIMTGFRSSVDDISKEKKKLLAYESWLFAGNAAFNISNYSSNVGTTAQTINKAIVNGKWRSCGEGTEGCKAEASTDSAYILGDYRTSSVMGWTTIVENAVGSANVQASPGVNPETAKILCNGDGCNEAKWVNDLTSDMQVVVLDFLKDSGEIAANEKTGVVSDSIFDITASSNPFLVASQIGHSLNAILVTAWTSGLLIATAAGAIGDSLIGQVGGGAGRGAVEYILTTVFPFISAAMIAGGVMAYVIPAIIAIRWLFAVLNWILVVIEAMAAAPLWAAIMLTPEGDGITGSRAERGIVIIAQLIITPLLLIVSLIATTATASVGFQLLNQMFFTDPTAFNNNGAIDFVLRLVFYVSLLTSVCWASASIIVDLPRSIMDWIGGGVARAFGNDVEQKSAQAIGKAENIAGQAVGAGANAVKGAINRKMRQSKTE